MVEPLSLALFRHIGPTLSHQTLDLSSRGCDDGFGQHVCAFHCEAVERRMDVGRKRRRAKLTSYYKSMAKVGEEQPSSQDNYGQTGGGKEMASLARRSLASPCASCTRGSTWN